MSSSENKKGQQEIIQRKNLDLRQWRKQRKRAKRIDDILFGFFLAFIVIGGTVGLLLI